ncbi:hypothetical protein [Lactococcus ileimucosae]|uniref:hypothetical protein n=1 Tax=Lactococcus ileimucosae TaxID=2941329 RepID=UPI001924086E|nr:hypothetical protein [Lactococcus ileimucosae]MBL3717094.1 hypothetical protein [Lactococcus garvieae]
MKQLTEENKKELENIAYSIVRLNGQFEDSYEFLTRGKVVFYKLVRQAEEILGEEIVWDFTGYGFCGESLDNASSAIWRIIDRT